MSTATSIAKARVDAEPPSHFKRNTCKSHSASPNGPRAATFAKDHCPVAQRPQLHISARRVASAFPPERLGDCRPGLGPGHTGRRGGRRCLPAQCVGHRVEALGKSLAPSTSDAGKSWPMPKDVDVWTSGDAGSAWPGAGSAGGCEFPPSLRLVAAGLALLGWLCGVCGLGLLGAL